MPEAKATAEMSPQIRTPPPTIQPEELLDSFHPASNMIQQEEQQDSSHPPTPMLLKEEKNNGVQQKQANSNGYLNLTTEQSTKEPQTTINSENSKTPSSSSEEATSKIDPTYQSKAPIMMKPNEDCN